ncbi:MAG: UDP-N-acetylglucosamine 1-carboxyvinyltransferase [Clostridia bacterium]|nr:UDP-N-acetylglucosamine 1-carboxyvinyltransferase [Clostridia bacterium]
MVEVLKIEGGHKLYGDITVSGAKNAALAIIPGALLVEGACRIENVPSIRDVKLILDMLRYLGAKVELEDSSTVIIDASEIKTCKAPYEMASKMRASYYLLGALLGRFGEAEVALPGGCYFGQRPIDLHEKGFRLLGANVRQAKGQIIAKAKTLRGASIFLDKISVGATINIILAAVRAEGTTIIENAAKEPHIVDLANFLNSMGANIRGAGTETIRVKGVERLGGGTYTIIPDQIEAGTFMLMAAATGGDVCVKNVIPKHMDSLSSKLIESGVEITECDDFIRVRRNGAIRPVKVTTLPYPGFPTDLQPQMVAFLSCCDGTSIVTENVWENRFQYIGELVRLNANITIEGSSARINGVKHLEGAPVRATDLRAGAAMVIAGLVAQGITEIHNPINIDRGYEDLEKKLTAIGAKIERVIQ